MANLGRFCQYGSLFVFFFNTPQELFLIVQLHKLIRIPHSIKELNKILLANDNRSRVIIGMETQTRGILEVLVDEGSMVFLEKLKLISCIFEIFVLFLHRNSNSLGK